MFESVLLAGAILLAGEPQLVPSTAPPPMSRGMSACMQRCDDMRYSCSTVPSNDPASCARARSACAERCQRAEHDQRRIKREMDDEENVVPD